MARLIKQQSVFINFRHFKPQIIFKLSLVCQDKFAFHFLLNCCDLFNRVSGDSTIVGTIVDDLLVTVFGHYQKRWELSLLHIHELPQDISHDQGRRTKKTSVLHTLIF